MTLARKARNQELAQSLPITKIKIMFVPKRVPLLVLPYGMVG